jgi:hypothetical protein
MFTCAARRRWATCIVALLVLLAPLRGWAHTTMHAGGPMPLAATVLPCHGTAPAEGALRDTADTAAPAASAACAMCDLCHGVALPAGPAPQAFRPDGGLRCVAAVAAGPASAAFGGPFRPPRA